MTTTVETEADSRAESDAVLIAAMRTSPAADVESEFELDVINDAERGRWIVALGADAIGELTYRFVGGRVVLLTTWVNHAYRNRRVATELIRRVLDEIRATGKKITIICPVVGEFIARNPQYLDLIDTVHPGSGAYPQPNKIEGGDDRLRTFQHDIA